jgi:alpha-beta hydrolase superfamily lysophospholipase
MATLVLDYSDYITLQMKREIFRSKPLFLYGESMGGAIVFNLCTTSVVRGLISGAILQAPMVAISEEMKLPDIVVSGLRRVAAMIPLAAITPIPSIIHRCFRNPEALKRNLEDSLGYSKKPRLGAALAMLDATEDIGKRLDTLCTPVLILHGDADVVTSPQMSASLYNACQVR